FRDRDPIVKDLARDVVNQLSAGTALALMTTSGKVKIAFTNDRVRIASAIDAFEGTKKQRRPGPVVLPPPTNVDAVNRGVAREAQGGLGPESGAARVQSALSTPDDLSTLFGDVVTYNALGDAARTLRNQVNRRKAFIFVSEGTAGNRTPGGDLQGAMLAEIRRSGVAVYTIDPRGHVPRGTAMMTSECSGDRACLGEPNQLTWVERAQRDLVRLSEQSGGSAIVNTDRLRDGVHDVIDQIENYYTIGFEPRNGRD